MRTVPAYVDLCSDVLVRVCEVDGELANRLLAIGFNINPEMGQSYIFNGDFKEPPSYKDIFVTLSHLGVFFSGGSSGWPPSAIVEYLLEEKILPDTVLFQEIYWSGPDMWRVDRINLPRL